MMNSVILGVGNVLERDDGVGVYATIYLQENYQFNPPLTLINGGVDGINLLNIFLDYEQIIILDTIHLEDTAGSIYAIPAHELSGYGLNVGGAHEIGVLQCLDILELQGYAQPQSLIVGIVPASIDFEINLSNKLKEGFDGYIQAILGQVQKLGFTYTQNQTIKSLSAIIETVRDPSK
jgi:hydrogenase maturation protease